MRGGGDSGEQGIAAPKETARTAEPASPLQSSPGEALPVGGEGEEVDPVGAGEGSAARSQDVTPTGQSEGPESLPPRQVIAVSASKGPAAFFNLARKFLFTDEMCDLSALEGAIVSAVDAAHLLERSKLATIVR